MEKINIFNETKYRIPRKKILYIVKKITKNKINISIVFVGNSLSKKLNKKYRSINKPTNVLSFNATDSVGEIYINLDFVKKNILQSDTSITQEILFLCIHGVLHILGYEHGEKMEKLETKYNNTHI